jgi:hypothetical protein
MNCPHCNMPASSGYPPDYTCGSLGHGTFAQRSPGCFQTEIAQLNAKVKRIEAAGDKLAERHLLVPTTYPQAQAHVAEYRREKSQP